MKNFLDELLEEVESKEKSEQLAYYDLALKEISALQTEISSIFSQSDREVEIIKSWALTKASKLQERVDFLSLKLESFIRSEGKKTIELPRGTLKLRKSPDRAEITNLSLFLESATSELLTVIPEQVKPDLIKIKAFIKLSGRIPRGVTITEGKEEFTYKLTKEVSDDTENQIRA